MSSRLRFGAVGLFLGVLVLATAGVRTRAQSPRQTVTVEGSVVDDGLNILPGVLVTLERTNASTLTQTSDEDGRFAFDLVPDTYRLRASRNGFVTLSRDVVIRSAPAVQQLPLVLRATAPAVPPASPRAQAAQDTIPTTTISADQINSLPVVTGNALNFVTFLPGVSTGASDQFSAPVTITNGDESYLHVPGSQFHQSTEVPLSTFGADVDTASYSNVRRFLNAGQLPPPDAVRVEELVNYFRFGYREPQDGQPLAITTEVGACPWAPSHRLVLIGARARSDASPAPAGRNIVLLIDVSGSMAPPERLPLIKTALGLFVDTLRDDDRVAIVTYAGTSGVALESTPVRERDVIHRAIDALSAGGSTNGGEGLIQAYRTAIDHYLPGGVNRVLLATDGDFNVGIVNGSDLVRLIEREKTSGVFLSVFGVGTGNLKDSTMELLADHGNGHYAYLDSLAEARRVLARESDAALETVAKDVKFQVEFNPATVVEWRLLGYDDRRLPSQGFNDDRKDGGEVGAGHEVTVLYEIVPVGAAGVPDDNLERPAVDPLKYQTPAATRAVPVAAPDGSPYSNELMTVKVRYKLPAAQDSTLLTETVKAAGTARAPDLAFAAAVAEFGLLLRQGDSSDVHWQHLVTRVHALDPSGVHASDRDALAELVDLAAGLNRLKR